MYKCRHEKRWMLRYSQGCASCSHGPTHSPLESLQPRPQKFLIFLFSSPFHPAFLLSREEGVNLSEPVSLTMHEKVRLGDLKGPRAF